MPGPSAPALQRLYQGWNDRRRGREFPARADFDPIDLKYVLGDLALVDVLRDPLRFRFRIHPTNVVEKFGFDLTGKLVDEIPDRNHRLLCREHFEEVVKIRTPIVQIRPAMSTDYRFWNCEILALPLSNHGTDVDMLMACVIWDEVPAAQAQRLPVSGIS